MSGSKTQSRSQSSKKAVSTKSKQSAKKKRSSAKRKEDNIQEEIALVAVLVIAVFLFASNFGIGGTVGDILSGFLFGCLGFFNYLFPLFVLAFVLYFLFYQEYRIEKIKSIAILLTCVSFIAILHLLMVPSVSARNLLDIYKYCAEYKIGGGVIGGGLALFLSSAFGMLGAYLILVGILVVCMVILTEHSFVNGVSKGSQKVYDSAKQDIKRRRIANERRIAEQKKEAQIRQERKERQERQQRQQRQARQQQERKAEFRRPYEEDDFKQKVTWNIVIPKESDGLKEIESEIPLNTEIDMEDTIVVNREAAMEKKEEFKKEVQKEEVVDIVPEAAVFPVEQKEALKKEAVVEKKATEEVLKVEVSDSEASQEEFFQFPPISLLAMPTSSSDRKKSMEQLQKTARHLQQVMDDFGVHATVTDASQGPSVTRFEVQPAQGVKVNKITALVDDIKLNLAVPDVRMEAPIPGKAAVGIEVPNKENSTVMLRELLESKEFTGHKSKIAFAVGKDIGGNIMVTDIAKMPHLLIAGATGSGKSVCINTLIMSILYKARPDEVKLIMIDPKVVELSAYNGIPHLLIPVVTDPKKASAALNWAVAEMMDRYDKFAKLNVRNLEAYNEKIESVSENTEDGSSPKGKKIPQIVIIVDELADLMMVAPGEVENAICRLAQLARAAGIHLIIATQRPSVNVITGLIKANMPSRIAFAVSSGVDSRTILDMNGAEKLLGKGDMLFSPYGLPKPLRVQGAFVSDAEVGAVVEFLSAQKSQSGEAEEALAEQIQKMQTAMESSVSASSEGGSDRDVLFADAGKFIIEKEKASIGMLQRWFKIGFNRAARIMDQLAQAGVVGEEEGTKARKVLMSMEEFEQFVDEYV